MSMNNFSFGSNLGSSQSGAGNQLEGNKIHEVTFKGAEKHEFPNRQDETQPYKVIRFKFEGKDGGTFEHTVFEPRPQDFERQINTRNDRKTGEPIEIPNPSNVESMMLFFKHLIDATSPETATKLEKGEINFEAKGWEDLRNKIIELVAPGVGAKTSIKLIKNNDGYARFPGFFAGVGRDDGKAYIRNNFIGKKLGFDPYEMRRIKKQEEAKPTDMGFTEPEVTEQDNEGLDMDFDLLSEL